MRFPALTPSAWTAKHLWCEKVILGPTHYDNFCENTDSTTVCMSALPNAWEWIALM